MPDACSTVTRLIDMGVESYLLGASLNMVLAQRLCRRICAKCKSPYEPAKAMRMAMERMEIETDEYVHGVGCKRCRNTGFAGRMAIHELLVIDDELREIITATPMLKAIRGYAKNTSMLPLRYDGLRKVKEGLTTVEEVFHVSGEGWLPQKVRNAKNDVPAKTESSEETSNTTDTTEPALTH